MSPPVGVDHDEDFGAVGSQRGIPKVKDAVAAKFDTVRAEGIESVDCLDSNLGLGFREEPSWMTQILVHCTLQRLGPITLARRWQPILETLWVNRAQVFSEVAWPVNDVDCQEQ